MHGIHRVFLTEEHKDIFLLRKGAKDAELFVLMFLCLRYLHTDFDRRTYFCLTQTGAETLRLCVRINNIVCESLWRLREIYLRRDSVYSVYCFPLTSSDSDFQFCVKKKLSRKGAKGAERILNYLQQGTSHSSLPTRHSLYLSPRLLKFVNSYFANLCCEGQ